MFDVLIENAMIIDGTGHPGFLGDLGIIGGQIEAVGHFPEANAAICLDARKRYLTPGFLDIHRHGDMAVFRPGYGQAELYQGLTSVVNGNCGLSAAPIGGPYAQDVQRYLLPVTGPIRDAARFSDLGAYLRSVQQSPALINNGMLVGMGTLRACVAGFRSGPLSDDEYRQLHQLLERALGDGALGVSLGLGYAPECFYTTEGLTRALAPLAETQVPVTVHMRQEGDGVEAALEEMLAVAGRLQLRLEISHLKAIGRRNWNRCVPRMLARLQQARAEGVDVACDVYPYTAGSTQLIHVLPPEFQEGGMEAMTAALGSAEVRQRMIDRMLSGSDFENITRLVGFENVQAIGLQVHPQLEGLTLADIAARQQKDPFTALFDLLEEEHCTAGMIDRITAQEDLDRIVRSPFSSIISDATYPESGLCHPRVYGNIAHFLEDYVVRRQVLPLESAICKLTSYPAGRLGLEKKGVISPGMDADLCLFDLSNLHETGTWQEPAQLAQGMDWVFVHGVPAIADGVLQTVPAGRLLTGV